jgi:hypothetical protein
MAAPSHAVTISRAAEILGEDEELLWDLVDEMEPEDGCLWIHGTHDQQTIAFTERGRRASLGRNDVQNGSASNGPISMPSTSRRPSLLTATATITATETMRPLLAPQRGGL